MRHTRTEAPDLELLPDPDEPLAAYAFTRYLISFYDGHPRWGTRNDANHDVAAGDLRDLLLLQRWIESRGAYQGLKAAADRDVSWRSLADGFHIQGPSTPFQRFKRLREVFNPNPRASGSADEEAAFRSHWRAVVQLHLPDALAIANEIIASIGPRDPVFDVASAEARADLLWVVEQAEEARMGDELCQLTTALDCLTASLEALKSQHSAEGQRLLERALVWRARYRKDMHG